MTCMLSFFSSGSPRARILRDTGIGLFALLLVALPHLAFAQSADLAQFGATAGFATTSLPIIIARVIRAIIGVIGVIFVCLVVYAGFLYLTAAGNPETAKRARQIIGQAMVGLIIVLSAFAITQFILNRLLGAAGLGNGVSADVAALYAEPLSGSLGAGIIEDHYPARNALDVPRNTLIMVTFKRPISANSVIANYDGTSGTGSLNTDVFHIYKTTDGKDGMLASSSVDVSFDPENPATFVFNPKDLLGTATEDTNYTVEIGSGLRTADGATAFTGAYANGYAWDFEVSTEVDSVPPTVVSVVPQSSQPEARNITVSVTFSEAMNPISVAGTYGGDARFSNIQVAGEDGTVVTGTYVITNGYRTVDFTPTDACGQDPCGDTIFCLPGSKTLTTSVRAASLGTEPPAATPVNGRFDGATDAAANSLDGNDDSVSQGSATDASETPDVDDDYAWSFKTSSVVESTVPQITNITPGILTGNANTEKEVGIQFSRLMKATTLNSSTLQLWPDPWYEFWFAARTEEVGGATEALLLHPSLVSSELNGWDYYPVVTNGVKSAWQICMYPALGPARAEDEGTCGTTPALPFCCDGLPSQTACSTNSGATLPDTSD